MEQVINSISSIPRKRKTLLIGIDGCGGSGKSTLADKLKMDCTDVTVVHMDDFYLPSPQRINALPEEKPIGADFDWKRMLKDVIEPLSQNKEGCYQRYDWDDDNLAEWHTVPVGGIVVIEGVYSLRNELVDKYDHTIWVDCPRDVRLSRGLARDGGNARDMWVNNWMVSEDLYVEAHKPLEKSNLLVTGIK
ncbi:uridine kinase [Planococcus halocryophilus]|nr:uridine kinase [Planococcus halocryophilus]MCH4825908.1 uridine kinase [Planococcus halocryophilus]